MGGVLGDVNIFGVLDGCTVIWHSVVTSLLNIIMAVRVVRNSQHVVVSVWTFIATTVDTDGYWHVGTGHDVGNTVEVESSLVIEGIVSNLLTDILNTDTNFLGCNTLLVVSDRHRLVVVVGDEGVVISLSDWCSWCVT